LINSATPLSLMLPSLLDSFDLEQPFTANRATDKTTAGEITKKRFIAHYLLKEHRVKGGVDFANRV